jgi:hypothetical protein
MSIVERINNQAIQVGQGARVGVQNLFLLICKIVSGLLLGLTFSLVGQEVLRYGPVPFWYVIVITASAFYRLSKSWGSIGLLIFNLLCILAALLVRMYVVVAPG